MRRKSVIRFCQRLHQFLQTASAELIEDGETTYVKVEIPKGDIDFSAVEGFSTYQLRDKTKDGKPEEWSFGVKDNDGNEIELVYHHATNEKQKTYFWFIAFQSAETSPAEKTAEVKDTSGASQVTEEEIVVDG